MTLFAWQRMTSAEFATFERSQGAQVVEAGGMPWRQARPFFFRPLLVWQEYSAASVEAPLRARIGGCQYAVPPCEPANSHLNMLLFRDTGAYTFDQLQRQARQHVRAALRELSLRVVDDPVRFKRDAYPVYLSFQSRTRYQYKSERRARGAFEQWAESVLGCPKNLVVAAYHGERLGAVAISRLVADTVVFATMFSTEDALRLNANSLLLHSLREGAAADPGVRQIFIAMADHTGRTTTQEFFLRRGCEVVRKPAMCRLNPAARLYLERRMPGSYALLLGRSMAPSAPAPEPVPDSRSTPGPEPPSAPGASSGPR